MDRLNAWLDEWKEAIAAAAKKHNGELLHGLSLVRLSDRLKRIRTAVDDDDIEKAVLWTSSFCAEVHRWETLFQKPRLWKEGRKQSSKKATNAQWNIPGWKPAALKEEFDRLQAELGPKAKPTTIYKKMAGKILKDKKHWRHIRTCAQK